MFGQELVVTHFTQVRDKLLTLSEEDVTLSGRFGGQNPYVTAASKFRDLTSILSIVKDVDPAIATEGIVNSVTTAMQSVIGNAAEIGKANPGEPDNVPSVRVSEFGKAVDRLELAAPAILAFQAYSRLPADLGAYGVDATTMIGLISRQVGIAKQAAEDAKKAAADTSASRQAKYFDHLAARNNISSRWWLLASFVIASTLIGYAVFQVYHPLPLAAVDRLQMIQKLVSKLVIVTVGSFSLVFSIKNYNTSMHNMVVNDHRAKSVTTFEAFVNSASTDETKEFVLKEACKTVFGYQSTGYLKGEGKATGLVWLDLLQALVTKKPG